MSEIPDDKLFGAHPKDLGTFDSELLDMKLGYLTVRQFIKLSKLINAGRNPVLKKHTMLSKRILDLIEANPDGIGSYDIANTLKEDYSIIRYYIKKLVEDNKVSVEKIITKEKREKNLYRLVKNGTN